MVFSKGLERQAPAKTIASARWEVVFRDLTKTLRGSVAKGAARQVHFESFNAFAELQEAGRDLDLEEAIAQLNEKNGELEGFRLEWLEDLGEALEDDLLEEAFFCISTFLPTIKLTP